MSIERIFLPSGAKASKGILANELASIGTGSYRRRWPSGGLAVQTLSFWSSGDCARNTNVFPSGEIVPATAPAWTGAACPPPADTRRIPAWPLDAPKKYSPWESGLQKGVRHQIGSAPRVKVTSGPVIATGLELLIPWTNSCGNPDGLPINAMLLPSGDQAGQIWTANEVANGANCESRRTSICGLRATAKTYANAARSMSPHAPHTAHRMRRRRGAGPAACPPRDSGLLSSHRSNSARMAKTPAFGPPGSLCTGNPKSRSQRCTVRTSRFR